MLYSINFQYSCYHRFISRADYPGEFFFEATLLDQSKRKISGFQQQSSKTASSDRWEKVEKIFVDYPPGVRFVKFRDGGKVSLFSAGHCGAKMVGAYVGFHQTRPGDGNFVRPGFLCLILLKRERVKFGTDI